MVCLISCLAYPTKSTSQISERYINKTPFTFSSACETLGNYIYYNRASNLIWDLHSYDQWLYKVDTLLSDVDSLNLNSVIGIDSSSFTECYRIKRIDDALHILIAEYVIDSSNYFGFRYATNHIEIDSNLNIISKQKYVGTNGSGIQLSDLLIIHNCKYLFGWISSDSSFYPCVIKQPLDDSIYSITQFTDSLPQKSVFANGYFIDSKLAVSIGSNYGSTINRLAILDTNLDVLNLVDMYDPTGEPVYFPNVGFLVDRNLSHPIYLSSVVGDYPFGQNQPYMLMGAGIMDSQLNFTRIDTFSFSGHNSTSPNGTINPKPTLQACNYANIDSILLVMPGQEMLYGFGYADKFANDVHLYNYNATSEDLNWHRIYNNGYTQSSFSPVATLPNNKYLVILNEYNWDKYNYDNLSIHLMILNSQGDLLEQKDKAFSRMPIYAYPNPFQGKLQLENLPKSTGELHYSLINSTGQEIDVGSIPEDGQLFLQPQLSGTYILRILNEGNLIQSIPLMAQ